MEPLHTPKAGRIARLASRWIATAALLAAASACVLQAQNPDHPMPPEPGQVQTFFLKNVTTPNDLNDIQTDLRNVLSGARIYGIVSENAITLRGTPEDLATAQKLIAELDRPKKIYRVTYIITELDGGKRLSSRSVSVLVTTGSKGTLRQGTRVPIVTGSTGTGSDITSQVQYVDVGLNLEAAVYGSQVRTKIEQTSVSDEKSNAGIQDPLIRQTTLEGTAPLGSGKPVTIGAIDMPGSTHQQQISVTADLLPSQD